jgi:hypothetical protein
MKLMLARDCGGVGSGVGDGVGGGVGGRMQKFTLRRYIVSMIMANTPTGSTRFNLPSLCKDWRQFPPGVGEVILEKELSPLAKAGIITVVRSQRRSWEPGAGYRELGAEIELG